MNAYSTRREISNALILRCAGILLGFIATALLIRSMGAKTYGTWAALTSLLTWIQLSDLGIGYALKNRIASAEKPILLLSLIGGAFQLFICISIFIILSLLIIGKNLSIVNEYWHESMTLYIGVIAFTPLTIGSTILQSLQKNALSSLFGFLQQLLWLICVCVLTWSNASLLAMCILYVITTIIVGIWQFTVGMNELDLRFNAAIVSFFNFKHIHKATPLIGIGSRFIALQISNIILFSLGTYLSYSNLSPVDAARYDILYKFFQLPVFLFNVVISVYWIEIAKLISAKNFNQLRLKFFQLQFIALCLTVLMAIFSKYIAPSLISIYSDGQINITTIDAIWFWLLTSIQIFAYAGAVFLNASENLYWQIVLAVLASILLIPLVNYLYRLGFGFPSVPIGTSFLILPSLIFCNWIAYWQVTNEFNKVNFKQHSN